MVKLLANWGEPVDSMLCDVVPVDVQVHVTVPLTATVSTAGSVVALRPLLKKMFPTVTCTSDGGGGGGPAVAVAVKLTGEPVAPETAGLRGLSAGPRSQRPGRGTDAVSTGRRGRADRPSLPPPTR